MVARAAAADQRGAAGERPDLEEGRATKRALLPPVKRMLEDARTITQCSWRARCLCVELTLPVQVKPVRRRKYLNLSEL